MKRVRVHADLYSVGYLGGREIVSRGRFLYSLLSACAFASSR